MFKIEIFGEIFEMKYWFTEEMPTQHLLIHLLPLNSMNIALISLIDELIDSPE